MVEVAAVHGRANESLNAGYGYVGILVAFLSRQNPLGVSSFRCLVGGLLASGGMLQRAHDLPDATHLGLCRASSFSLFFSAIRVYGRLRMPSYGGERCMQSAACRPRPWGIAVALAGGAMRGSIPYMFVSLGECLTEKSGKINLGMEGVLLMGAMTAFAVSRSHRLALAGRAAPQLAGRIAPRRLHAWFTQQPAVNDVAAGIAMIIFGSGLAFFFGKRFVAPMAPQLPAARSGQLEPRARHPHPLCVSARSSLSASRGFRLNWFFTPPAGDCMSAPPVTIRRPRAPWHLRQRRPLHRHHDRRRAGRHRRRAPHPVFSRHLVGRHLRRPGTHGRGAGDLREMESAALPLRPRCFFGGAQAIGPSLQSLGIDGFYYLFNASPYLLTLR